MQATLMTRQPAPTLACAGVRLRRCVRADAFGNALGSSVVGMATQGSQQEAKLPMQGVGPWSGGDYVNGMDLQSDNAYRNRQSQPYYDQIVGAFGQAGSGSQYPGVQVAAGRGFSGVIGNRDLSYSASEAAGDLVRESARGGWGIGDTTRQGLWEVSMQADMAVIQGAKNATQWGRLSRFAGYGLDMQDTAPGIAQSVLSLSNSDLLPALQSLGDNNLWGNSQARFSPITQILLGGSPLGNHLGAGAVDNLPVIGLLSSAGGGRYGSQMVLIDQLQSIGAIDNSARATMAQAINASWQNATLNAAVGTLTLPLGLPRTILAEGMLHLSEAQAGIGGTARGVKGLAAGIRTLGGSLDLLEGLVGVGKATRGMGTVNYGALSRQRIGDPPANMVDPHAHHILYKEGNGAAQKALVGEGQTLLRKYDIDPIMGPENMVWAPNRVAGQHGPDALRNVVDNLKLVHENIGTRAAMVNELTRLGRVAAQRK